MSETFLTKEEVAELTGFKTKRRQTGQLRKMGLPFWLNAAEAPIVPRSAIEGKVTARPPVPKPQWVPPGLRTVKN